MGVGTLWTIPRGGGVGGGGRRVNSLKASQIIKYRNARFIAICTKILIQCKGLGKVGVLSLDDQSYTVHI
jgi:hypothetical protein